MCSSIELVLAMGVVLPGLELGKCLLNATPESNTDAWILGTAMPSTSLCGVHDGWESGIVKLSYKPVK